jgi:hypothetical protein
MGAKRISMRLAAYGFPRRPLLGNLVNRGNRLISKLTLIRGIRYPARAVSGVTKIWRR